jgi:hypothetical protein
LVRSLGLGQYDATFRDNGIGADVLFDLAEADFESWASSWGTAGG